MESAITAKRVLITGDYSHRDFKNLVTKDNSAILLPFNQALHQPQTLNSSLSLVVIAQSFPGQFSQNEIEQLQDHYRMIPFVAILGSWCEGETRSGKPWPGVPRIYWHQWQGRFELFQAQLEKAHITAWHEPQTSTVSDRVLRVDPAQALQKSHQRRVGISAHVSAQFAMLQDALKELGFSSFWIELFEDQGTLPRAPDLICIDANGLGSELKSRIDWLRGKYPESPFIVVCNFPRAHEVQELISWNVARIVSKPYELHDLDFAVKASLGLKPPIC